jgi:hypothetical protein
MKVYLTSNSPRHFRPFQVRDEKSSLILQDYAYLDPELKSAWDQQAFAISIWRKIPKKIDVCNLRYQVPAFSQRAKEAFETQFPEIGTFLKVLHVEKFFVLSTQVIDESLDLAQCEILEKSDGHVEILKYAFHPEILESVPILRLSPKFRSQSSDDIYVTDLFFDFLKSKKMNYVFDFDVVWDSETKM